MQLFLDTSGIPHNLLLFKLIQLAYYSKLLLSAQYTCVLIHERISIFILEL